VGREWGHHGIEQHVRQACEAFVVLRPAEPSGLYGESTIFRHFKSESAMKNRNLHE